MTRKRIIRRKTKQPANNYLAQSVKSVLDPINERREYDTKQCGGVLWMPITPSLLSLPGPL